MPAKTTVKCPSCEAEVFAGKYCLECGAVLITEKSAIIEDDVIEKIAEAVYQKIDARKRLEEIPNGPKIESVVEPVAEPVALKRGLFKRG
jgi:hypothetical protein